MQFAWAKIQLSQVVSESPIFFGTPQIGVLLLCAQPWRGVIRRGVVRYLWHPWLKLQRTKVQRPGCKNFEALITLDGLFAVHAQVLGVVDVVSSRTTI